MDTFSFSNHFLLAMPNMADPLFAGSLVYVCEHGEHGAMGIIINKPSGIALAQLLEQVTLPVPDNELGELPVHFGGPVQPDRGFVLHTPVGSWQSSLLVTDDIALTTSKDVLSAVSVGEEPRRLLVSLGYSGWSAGQLEEEIGQNAWLTVPASAHILFDMSPAERYHAAMSLLGINPNLLSADVGHA